MTLNLIGNKFYSLFGVLLLGAFALVCSSQISDMLGGECSLARGFGGMLLKAMAVAAVVVPVWLDSRRSKW